jgi:alpha-L-fucosidase
MDFANDDRFNTAWQSNPTVKEPWFEVLLGKEQPFNMIVIAEKDQNIGKYELEYNEGGEWKKIFSGEHPGKIKIHRFERVWGSKVRIRIQSFKAPPAIAEFGVYNERT